MKSSWLDRTTTSLPLPSSRKPMTDPTSSKAESTPLSPREIERNESTPLLATSIATPSAIARHTMLWRAGSKVKTELFYNQHTQEIDLAAIVSAPGDQRSQLSIQC